MDCGAGKPGNNAAIGARYQAVLKCGVSTLDQQTIIIRILDQAVGDGYYGAVARANRSTRVPGSGDASAAVQYLDIFKVGAAAVQINFEPISGRGACGVPV